MTVHAPDAVGHDVVVGSIVMHRTPNATYWGVEYVSHGGLIAVVRNIHGGRALVAAADVVVQQDVNRVAS